MKEKLGLGVAGAGAIGIRSALNNYALGVVDTSFIAAVCDPVPGRAKAAAEKYGVPAWYETYEELLEDPGVDVVTLCSQIGLHYEQGMQAIAAGKHVHFNKTMTVTTGEATNIIEAAIKKSVKCVASPGSMAFPQNVRTRRYILEGKLGKITWALGGNFGALFYHLGEKDRKDSDILGTADPSWYFKKPGGGPLYDTVVYCLHKMTGVLGPARKVTAMSGQLIPSYTFEGREIASEVDDNTFILIDFGDAVFGIVYGTPKDGPNARSNGADFYGLQGSIVSDKFADEPLLKEEDAIPYIKKANEGFLKGSKEAHVFLDILQLIDWVLHGVKSPATCEQARHVIEIFEAGYRAAKTGKTQKLTTTFSPIPLEELKY